MLAQAIVTAMFLLAARRETTLFPISIPSGPARDGHGWRCCGSAFRCPSRACFSSLSMFIRADRGRLGDAAIAAQKVGTQIESISYTTSGGLRHRSKRLYCPELRCPQTGPYLPGILDGRGNDRRMELFYHRYAGGVPRTSGTSVHPGGRGGPHRRKLSAYHGLFSDPHVPGDHLLRRLPGV